MQQSRPRAQVGQRDCVVVRFESERDDIAHLARRQHEGVAGESCIDPPQRRIEAATIAEQIGRSTRSVERILQESRNKLKILLQE